MTSYVIIRDGTTIPLSWDDNPIWFITLFFLTPIWISFHFYWIHRFLHCRRSTGWPMPFTTATRMSVHS